MKVTFVIATRQNFILENIYFGEEVLITEAFNLNLAPIAKGKVFFSEKHDVLLCSADIPELYHYGTPAISGVTENIDGINKFFVEQVGICFSPNEDKKIQSIGIQINNQYKGARKE